MAIRCPVGISNLRPVCPCRIRSVLSRDALRRYARFVTDAMIAALLEPS